jgi:hypothetical protein
MPEDEDVSLCVFSFLNYAAKRQNVCSPIKFKPILSFIDLRFVVLIRHMYSYDDFDIKNWRNFVFSGKLWGKCGEFDRVISKVITLG